MKNRSPCGVCVTDSAKGKEVLVIDGEDSIREYSAYALGCEISEDPSDPLLPIWQVCKSHYPDEDLSVLHRAYERAVRQHTGQRRKSGEPYIIHPLAVSQILADLGMGPKVVAAGLLHDTVEDTDYTLDECREEFGDTIAGLVDGVTKLTKLEYGDLAQAETIRKMIIAMSRDVRVLVVKLADRVHNARTWRYVKARSARSKALETIDVYAPLANRLGINTIKTELEELSFKVLYPDVYPGLVMAVQRKVGQGELNLQHVINHIETDLGEQNIEAYVAGRLKDHYSIYQKLQRGHDLSGIYDLIAVRIITDSIRDCYAALGIVHSRWSPVPGRFKDYIAMPKLNMYQSLHTTVIGPGGRPVEIQIRTWDMHRRAEFGIAAHWKYKENGQAGRALSSPDKSDRERESNVASNSDKIELTEEDSLKWIQNLADWTNETPSEEFLGTLKNDIGPKEVYVFTPKGNIITLPEGATPVDFAYAVHTEVGHRAQSVRINGRMMPMDTVLENGDTVEILTFKNGRPSPSQDWLSFAKSAKARNKIRQWFAKERREESIEAGHEDLVKAMRKRNVPLKEFMKPASLAKVASELKLNDADSLYEAIGKGQISTQNVISRLVKDFEEKNGKESEELILAFNNAVSERKKRRKKDSVGVEVTGLKDVWVKLAKCCMPVPGDAIIGFVTRLQGVSVHREDCENIISMRKKSPERIVDVRWTTSRGTFLVKIQVVALDRGHLLSEITGVLSDFGVNIFSGSQSTNDDRVAISEFTFEMVEPSLLNRLLTQIRRIDGVYDAYRITGTADNDRRMRHLRR